MDRRKLLGFSLVAVIAMTVFQAAPAEAFRFSFVSPENPEPATQSRSMADVSNWETYGGDDGGQFWSGGGSSSDRDLGQLSGGDPVPLPSAIWLFGTGLVGLVGDRIRRRRG